MQPYAPPPAGGYGYPPPQAYAAHPYQAPPPPPYVAYPQGDRLVVSIGACPPGPCAKCGGEATERKSENFRYTPGWAYACYFAGLLVGVIVVAVTTKQGMVHVPICRTCHDRWRSANLAYGLSFLGLLVPFISLWVILTASRNFDAGIAIFFLTLVLAIVVPIIIRLSMGSRRLTAALMDDQYVTIAGVHPAAIQGWSAAAMRPMMPGAAMPQAYPQQPYPQQPYPPRY